MKPHDSLNVGKRIQGLARCLCDDEHKMEYLGILIGAFNVRFIGLKYKNVITRVMS